MPETLHTGSEEQAATILYELRQSTADMHKKLEDTTLSRSLMKDETTQEDYSTYLSAMKPVIAFMESNIFPLLTDIVPFIEKRKKLSAISEDLSTLAPAEADLSFHPSIEQMTPSFALGFMYVTEGSVLGGKFILKHLSQRLGISAENGGKFFFGYGSETGSMWRSFLDALTAHAIKHDADEVINGARFAFTAIHEHFEKAAR